MKSTTSLFLLVFFLALGDSLPIGIGVPWCMPILDLIPSFILGPVDFLKCSSLVKRGLVMLSPEITSTTPSPLDEYLEKIG